MGGNRERKVGTVSSNTKVVIGDATLCGIYTITHIHSGKVYVGSSVNIVRRWNQHKSDLNLGRHKSPKLQAAWRKHGADSFLFEVVEIVLDGGRLIECEQAWIDRLQTILRGYNFLPASASRLGTTHTPETREKMVAARRKRVSRPCSEETKKKISEAQKGRKKQPHSAEYRARMSELMKGRKLPPQSEAQKAQTAARLRGSKLSDETRAKMAESHRQRWAKIKEAANV